MNEKSYSLKLLYSGSDGNAALLTAGDIAILIDAGRTAKALTAALAAAGVTPDALSAILLTHEHRDHTAALNVFLKHHPIPVHTTTASAMRLREKGATDALCACLVEHAPLFQVEFEGVTVTSFETSHDSACSVGYRISLQDGEDIHTVGYATDLGTVTPAVENALTGCEAVVIECNHEEEMLMTGPYPADLKRRIASVRGHLSNRDCAALCARLATCGTKRFLLAHLSEINNVPDLALSEVTAALAGTDAVLSVADPFITTEL